MHERFEFFQNESGEFDRRFRAINRLYFEGFSGAHFPFETGDNRFRIALGIRFGLLANKDAVITKPNY